MKFIIICFSVTGFLVIYWFIYLLQVSSHFFHLLPIFLVLRYLKFIGIGGDSAVLLLLLVVHRKSTQNKQQNSNERNTNKKK